MMLRYLCFKIISYVRIRTSRHHLFKKEKVPRCGEVAAILGVRTIAHAAIMALMRIKIVEAKIRPK